jgi:hypothetical protein
MPLDGSRVYVLGFSLGLSRLPILVGPKKAANAAEQVYVLCVCVYTMIYTFICTSLVIYLSI